MSVDEIHKISTNLKPACSLGVDQDAKAYNQNIAEKSKQEQTKQPEAAKTEAAPQ